MCSSITEEFVAIPRKTTGAAKHVISTGSVTRGRGKPVEAQERTTNAIKHQFLFLQASR